MIDVVDWKGKRVNKEQVCCPVDFSEELIAVFKLKKTRIRTEFDKKRKVFQFSKNFMHLLSKFRQTSRIEMLKTVVRVRICCAVMFHEELIAVFKLKKTRIGTEFYKKPKIFQFSKNFMQLLSKFRQTSRIEMLKTVLRVRICCAVMFYEWIIAVIMLKHFSKWL